MSVNVSTDVRVENASEAELTPCGTALRVTRGDYRVVVALGQIEIITFDGKPVRSFGFGS